MAFGKLAGKLKSMAGGIAQTAGGGAGGAGAAGGAAGRAMRGPMPPGGGIMGGVMGRLAARKQAGGQGSARKGGVLRGIRGMGSRMRSGRSMRSGR